VPYDLTDLAVLAALPYDDVIDVRSPAEFAEDHMPGAVNLPVLSNEERARVGTHYVRVDRFEARRMGAALVARNASRHLETYLSTKGGGYRPLVYCWRGGMRSGSFATILSAVGWRTQTLAGGYRTYRRLVAKALYDDPWPSQVVVLAGATGTGKTAILSALAERGVQTIDLEGAAEHRGSLFGGTGAQPSQKMFETRIAAARARLRADRPVVVEAESSKVGERLVPPALWAAMGAAPVIEVRAPIAERARYTADVYADMAADPARLAATIERLRPYHPRERVGEWLALAASGAFEDLAADLMREHYDRRYRAPAGPSDREPAAGIALTRLDAAGLAEAADRIVDALRTIGSPGDR